MTYHEIPAYKNKNANIKLMGFKGSNLKRISEILNIDTIWIDLEKGVLRVYTESSKKFKNATKYFGKYLENNYDKYVKCTNPCKKQRIF